MPKENKSSSRRSKRHSLEANDERSCTRDSVKTPLGSKRYSPFQRDTYRRDSRDPRDFKELRESVDLKELRERRDSRELKEPRDSKDSKDTNEDKESMTLTLHKSNGIIGNGIKYIMFPLHLLNLCIFGTNSNAISDDKQTDPRDEKLEAKKDEQAEERNAKKEEDKDERKTRKDRSKTPEAKSSRSRKSSESKKSKEEPERKKRSESPLKRTVKKEINSENDDSSDEMVTAPEDSDSASDHWASASDSMLMNMSVEYDHGLEKSMSIALEEPMDVSMDEHFERSLSSIKVLRDEKKSRKDERRSRSPRGHPDGQESSNFRSVDEEIATIFQKQCTSSEDESPVVPRAVATKSCRESKLPCRTENRDSPAGSRTKKTVCDNNNNNGEERKKKTTNEIAMNKRRKTSREDDASQRRTDRRIEEEIMNEKYRSREDTPSKRRSRSSRTPSKAKSSTRREHKYKEIATQTDYVLSDEEDVEMTPLESKTTDKWSCNKTRRRLYAGSPQIEEMDQDQDDYIADNEDSNDGYVKFVRKRISSVSTSSSSSNDFGYDERKPPIRPESKYRLSEWKIESQHIAFENRMASTRAPPGFPEQPQHPPLTAFNSSNYFTMQSMTSLDNRYDYSQGSNVPPAPKPMRHMYYNYPEFMDLPENVGSSKILWNIIRNNYR